MNTSFTPGKYYVLIKKVAEKDVYSEDLIPHYPLLVLSCKESKVIECDDDTIWGKATVHEYSVMFHLPFQNISSMMVWAEDFEEADDQ